MKINVMGVKFDNVTMDEAAEIAEELLKTGVAAMVVTPNAEIVYEAMHDEAFCALLNSASLILPDGAGVVLGSRILKTPLKQKVAGIEFAERLLSLLAKTGGRVYLLGGKPGIGELAAEKMCAAHPGLRVCGISDGYFLDDAPVIEAINASGADVLFVCLGAPKQEQFMQRNRAVLNVRIMAGLGGSLDAFAGMVKRAPHLMIRLNLEWLYRLCKEPQRFGRMMRLPKFVFAVLFARRRG